MSSTELFAHDDILDDDPVDAQGRPLEVLHDREYRVRAFRVASDRVLIRGGVRDQKPPGLYLDVDPDPLTVHHMQVDIEVALNGDHGGASAHGDSPEHRVHED